MSKPPLPRTIAGQVTVDVDLGPGYVRIRLDDDHGFAECWLDEGDARELADWIHRAASDVHASKWGPYRCWCGAVATKRRGTECAQLGAAATPEVCEAHSCATCVPLSGPKGTV